MWLPLTASSRPLSGLRCTEVVLWSPTVSKALVVSVFGGVVTIIAGAYRTARMYVSDGTDASFGRYESSYRPKRVFVPSETRVRAFRNAHPRHTIRSSEVAFGITIGVFG